MGDIIELDDVGGDDDDDDDDESDIGQDPITFQSSNASSRT